MFISFHCTVTEISIDRSGDRATDQTNFRMPVKLANGVRGKQSSLIFPESGASSPAYHRTVCDFRAIGSTAHLDLDAGSTGRQLHDFFVLGWGLSLSDNKMKDHRVNKTEFREEKKVCEEQKQRLPILSVPEQDEIALVGCTVLMCSLV